MHPFTKLGLALRWMRSRRGLEQQEVAKRAGITRAMLSSYETGRQNPSLDTLGKILLALEADLPDLHEALLVHRGAPRATRDTRRASDRAEPA